MVEEYGDKAATYIYNAGTKITGTNASSALYAGAKVSSVASRVVPIVGVAVDFGTQVIKGENLQDATYKTMGHVVNGTIVGAAVVALGVTGGWAIIGAAVAGYFVNSAFDKIYDMSKRTTNTKKKIRGLMSKLKNEIEAKIYICKDKERHCKIFFDSEKNEFSSKHYREHFFSNSSSAFSLVILGTVFLRDLNFIVFNENPISWLIFFIVLGSSIGKIIGILKKRKEETVVTKKISVSQKDLSRYLNLAEEQLDQAKGLILVLVIMIVLGAILSLLFNEMFMMLGTSYFCGCLIYSLDTTRFSDRSNLYSSLLTKNRSK